MGQMDCDTWINERKIPANVEKGGAGNGINQRCKSMVTYEHYWAGTPVDYVK